jgi:hypothetical protein
MASVTALWTSADRGATVWVWRILRIAVYARSTDPPAGGAPSTRPRRTASRGCHTSVLCRCFSVCSWPRKPPLLREPRPEDSRCDLFLTGALALSVIGVTPSVSGREQVQSRPGLTHSVPLAGLSARCQPPPPGLIANGQQRCPIPAGSAVGCTPCWAVLTLLTFSERVRYPLRDDSWNDRQDQRAIPVGAPCH